MQIKSNLSYARCFVKKIKDHLTACGGVRTDVEWLSETALDM